MKSEEIIEKAAALLGSIEARNLSNIKDDEVLYRALDLVDDIADLVRTFDLSSDKGLLIAQSIDQASERRDRGKRVGRLAH